MNKVPFSAKWPMNLMSGSRPEFSNFWAWARYYTGLMPFIFKIAAKIKEIKQTAYMTRKVDLIHKCTIIVEIKEGWCFSIEDGLL
ncbi:hypothetical protein C2I18_27740 [Paenibacillus sp. PK3_47]|nr:hypothetical protein C2I18_27740 [Paenibacillus sp. PK3_47]